MLIPKISYSNKTTGTINGQSIMVISLKNTSTTNSTITNVTWAINVINGPGTAVLSFSNDIDASVVIDNTQDIEVNVTLSVEDSDGFIANTNVALIKDSNNVSFIGQTVDSYKLPSNLIEFTVIDDLQVINGAPVFNTPAYTQYAFDKENDSVNDDTNSSPTTFSHIYNSSNVIANLISTGGNAPFAIATEISFNPIIENPEALNISISDDCKIIKVYSETKDYLSKLIGRGSLDNSAMTKLDVTLTKNCCSSTAQTVSLAPTYDLDLSQGTYVPTGTILPDYFGGITDYEINEVPITILGIDANVISSITYSNRGEISTTNVVNVLTEPPTITVEVLLETGPDITGAQVTQTNFIEITTVENFVYRIEYTLAEPYTFVDGMTLTVDSITYPELPCGITINQEPFNTTLSIDSNFGGTDCDADLIPFADGIVQVTLNDSGISNESVSNCLFVDCNTYCIVVEALSQGCNPIIGVLYEALVYSKNCPDRSCQNLCDLYETFALFMDQCDCTIYQNNIVSSGNDCGCN